jgi:hypothetical protein
MALNVVCTVIFVIITFIYYYSFQGDILGMTQYAWSDHETHYDRLTGCLIFTAIAILIKSLTGFLLEFPQRLKALVYLPAMMLSGLATAETVDSNGNVSIPWGVIIFTVVVLTLYPFVVSKLKNLSDYNVSERDGSTILTAWWTNMLVILLLTVMMYSMGNTDRTLHTRLKVERLCHEGKYDEALAVGVPKYDRDKALTMWRALALAKTDAMGERLFRYNISNAQKTLLPKQTGEPHALLRDCYPIWQALGFVPRKIDERPEWYLKRYPDLQAAVQEWIKAGVIKNEPGAIAWQLYQHFLMFGMEEADSGRYGNALFNVKKYKAAYADLQQAFGDGSYKPYYYHYMQSGAKEIASGARAKVDLSVE